ncbi:hypothetical protein ABT269_39770 [Streptomyces viridosporus]|uniref:hypothetical protein n=1 Tax=Streptomyces viridosporus TaxID=67581 RepID=UPI00332A1FF0
MFEYTLPVRGFTAQRAHLAAAPATIDDYQPPAVDDAHDPARITVHALGEDAALRDAERHLALLHARRAHAAPGTVPRIAADLVYAEARARAETLTPGQREEEREYARCSDDDDLRYHALIDVMRERGEIPA